jgi:hypothetical protein
MLYVVVGVEGREPDDAAVAALHPPHPVDRVGVDPADRRVEHDAAERLDARDVLPCEPGAVGGRGDVVLEDDHLDAAVAVDRRRLVVVDRAAEHVGRGMDMRVHEPGDRVHQRRRRREDAASRRGGLARGEDRARPARADHRELAPAVHGARREARASCVVRVVRVPAAEMDGAPRLRPAATVGEFPARKTGRSQHRVTSGPISQGNGRLLPPGNPG